MDDERDTLSERERDRFGGHRFSGVPSREGHRRAWLKCGNLILLMALMAGICVTSMACATPQEPEFAEVEEGAFTPLIEGIEMLHEGEKAPLFEVSDVFGNRVNLADRIGKNVIVLLFWSVYCDPCRSSMPAYNEIYLRNRQSGLDFLAVNLDGAEMAGAIQAFLEEENLKLTVLLDEPQGDFLKIADPYGVQGTPTIYIIDKNGRIAFAKAGVLSFEQFSSLVKKELAKK